MSKEKASNLSLRHRGYIGAVVFIKYTEYISFNLVWGASEKIYIFTLHHNNITYLIPAHETTHLPPEERGYISTDLYTYSTYADYVH